MNENENENVNKERVALWVEALRDPTLVQGTKKLATRENPEQPWKQCCLDVACQVAIENGVRLEVAMYPASTLTGNAFCQKRGYWDSRGDGTGLWNFNALPQPVMDWYGFKSSKVIGMKMPGNIDPVDAVVLNDCLGLTFPQIADILEANFLQAEE